MLVAATTANGHRPAPFIIRQTETDGKGIKKKIRGGGVFG